MGEAYHPRQAKHRLALIRGAAAAPATMTQEMREAFEHRRVARDRRIKKLRVVSMKRDAGEFVFVSKEGRPLGSFRKRCAAAIAATKIPARVKRLSDGTEIKQAPRPHDFRRTVARNLDALGVQREVAKRVLGHKTDAVYTRYRIVSHDEIRDVTRRLDARAARELIGTRISFRISSGSLKRRPMDAAACEIVKEFGAGARA